MTRNRLVLLVEGDGDMTAVPILIKRLLVELDAFSYVVLDPNPLRVGEFSSVARSDFGEWRRFLAVAMRRKQAGACLLLLDGDSRTKLAGLPFCAAHAATRLVDEARNAGAEETFSVAVVFACMEFESWLIAGCASLAGTRFLDGRAGLNESVVPPAGDLELAPRDAKGWLNRNMKSGNKPTADQAELTRIVDLFQIRQRKMKSFQRLERAVQQLAHSITTGKYSATPPSPADNPKQSKS